MRIAFALGAAWASLIVPAATHAQIPPGYEVIRLTDDPDLDGPPAINSLGHVVWSKRIDQGFDTEEIFLWDGVQVRRITNDTVRDAFPDINDHGTIVWSRAKRPGEPDNLDIVLWRNGELTHVTDDELRDSAASINNLNHVAWYQTPGRNGCSGTARLFLYDGIEVHNITDPPLGIWDQGVDINDLDELAWTRYDFCQNPWMGTIMLYSGGVIFELTDGMGQDQSATLNNIRQVAWGWGWPDQEGIALWEDEMTRDITSWGNLPRLNNRSDVAFIRWHEDVSLWQQWLWKDGVLYQLSDGETWSADGFINDCTEVAWHSGVFPSMDIYLMRLVPGDTNHDGIVALSDVDGFYRCMTGPKDQQLSCGSRSSDIDGDGDVDLRDYAILGARTNDYVQYEALLGCMTGPRGVSSRCDCLPVDFDRDRDVDLKDFASFQTLFRASP